MFEAYFDDSGTNAQSDIAIAACYISTQRGWKAFNEQWDNARTDFGFDVFHMAEFVAPNSQGHEPWCGWSNEKKVRAYQRLATIINENKRTGIACALPKDVYDQVPEKFRRYYGMEHYTFAVRMCIMRILEWRKACLISLPMKYVFDWERPGTPKHIEISNLMNGVHEKLSPLLGLDGGGYSFRQRKTCKPLQAADILAWQMNSHMRKVYPQGENLEKIDEVLHPGFRQLRQDQEMDLGFFNEIYIKAWIEGLEKEEGFLYPEVGKAISDV